MEEDRFFCSQTIQRLGAFAKWPGANPRLPWHVDVSGHRGSMTAAEVLEAFRLAWAWWAEQAEITPVMVGSVADALVRKHFARIDGLNGILAWSELADNTNQPKTQRYDNSENWRNSETLAGGMDLVRVAAHEIGHVLGLEHDSPSAAALMRPSVSEGIRKPTARDFDRLYALGYKKRTTPIPDPVPPLPPVPDGYLRILKPLNPGTHGDIIQLGSALGPGDYLPFLIGDGLPPPVPPSE